MVKQMTQHRNGSARKVALATVAVVVSAACSLTPAETVQTTPSAAESVATPEATSSMVADDKAPEELQGRWEATISTGEHVTLEVRASGYTVNREGSSGSGAISVEGQEITFTSSLCELGPGTYEWSIDEGTLTFTPLEPRDPCGNRIIFLEDAAYTRAD